jgi:hypothetical protein
VPCAPAAHASRQVLFCNGSRDGPFSSAVGDRGIPCPPAHGRAGSGRRRRRR